MKFPSIKSLADDAIATFKRFPFEVLFALAGTIAATIYIHSDDELPYSFYTKIFMTANLGLVLSLAATLYLESKGKGKRYLVRLAVALLACSTIFIYNRQLRGIDGMRFLLLSLAFHMMVSFAAFTAKGQIQGFWQFNKTLFLRILASILYSSVLYLGLAAAISASNFLFNLHIEYKTYGILYAWIAGMFNTMFFLAGVPSRFTELDSDESYPKGLKVFTQYVLIPLASVYVIILLAYEVKLLIQWSLPKGLVSNLILGYAVFGILSILLIYPLRNRDGNTWIKTFARSFYFLLIPLLVLLFLAVGSRIIPYGITPERYFLIVLACWLTFVTFYFLLSRQQSIKIIPVSLCIVTLLTIYGPQSAFTVSANSQRALLVQIFKKYGADNDGKLTSMSKLKVSKNDGQEIIARLNYFIYDNDFSGLQPCIGKDIAQLTDSLAKKTGRRANPYRLKTASYYIDEYDLQRNEMGWAVNYLGVSRFDEGETNTQVTDYYFSTENSDFQTVTGYDYLLKFNNYRYGNNDDTTSIKGANIVFKQHTSVDNAYTLYINDEKVSFDIKSIADSLVKTKDKLNKYLDSTSGGGNYTMPKQMLSFTRQTRNYRVTLIISEIRFTYTEGDVVDMNNVSGVDLIRVLK